MQGFVIARRSLLKKRAKEGEEEGVKWWCEMPRIKLTRSVLYLFLVSFVSFVAFNVWMESNRRSGQKSSAGSQSHGEATSLESVASKAAAVKRPSAEALSDLEHSNNNNNLVDLDGSSDGLPESLSLEDLWTKRKARPWFFANGAFRPSNLDSFPFHKLPVWPDEAPLEDRIVNQLMYQPLNYNRSDKKLKKILLWFGRGGWAPRDLPMGQTRFLRDNCPVNTCELSMDANDAEEADAIFFKACVYLFARLAVLHNAPYAFASFASFLQHSLNLMQSF